MCLVLLSVGFKGVELGTKTTPHVLIFNGSGNIFCHGAGANAAAVAGAVTELWSVG